MSSLGANISLNDGNAKFYLVKAAISTAKRLVEYVSDVFVPLETYEKYKKLRWEILNVILQDQLAKVLVRRKSIWNKFSQINILHCLFIYKCTDNNDTY